MPEDTRRRYLIATGVTTGLPKTASRLIDSVAAITAMFGDKFGYERATDLDINPPRDQLRRNIREFAKGCGPDDFLAIYHSGHADVVAGKHRLWMGDTSDPVADTLVTSDLVELILAETPVCNLLIIIDSCFAGQGGTEAVLEGFKSVGNFSGKTLLAVTAAHPKQQVRAGDFARLFERAVDHPATAGYEPQYLSLPAIVGHMNKDPERKKWQTISYTTVLGTGDAPFLPNPRYNTTFHGFDLATQLRMEQDEQRQQDLERFFNPRARGVDVPQESGWNFVGRHVALRDLTAWLTNRDDSRSVVVTGDPGSGKSAVIGRLAILSHHDWGRAVPRHGLPADTIPPVDSIDVAIHARNRTSDEVLQALCAAAHITAATPGEFLRKRSGEPMVAAIDAIDEAIDPERLVAAILNPLIDAGPASGLRLLLGTRSYLLDRLNSRASRVDLDDTRYADPESLRRYTERMLRVIDGSPYASADDSLVLSIAAAVAQAAGRSFLVALISSRTIAALGHLVDPADPLWREALPATAAQAMHQDLETRLRDNATRARDLLRPLAYAGGNGLPWEDIWAPLASSLAGREYRDEDLIWLRRQAGSYVVEALESGRSVYRLYHAALAEYLRQDNDEAAINSTFVDYLLSQVPRNAAGNRDWTAAHPYALSHLATHAAAAGQLGRLLSDPCYLVTAASSGLLAAFSSAPDPRTRQVAVAYQRAMHRLRENDLADRLSYLELAARRAGAAGLAERIAAYPMPRRWSVRWVRSPRDHPHRVLAGHQGPVREVVSIGIADGMSQAASVGDDGTLRLWDLEAGESVSVHQVSDTGLTAVDLVELPGPRPIMVVLSGDGILTAYEFPSMARLLSFPVHSGIRGVLHPAQLVTTEMRCVLLPDGRNAVVTGGPGMMTAIWNIQDGSLIVRLPAGIRPSMLQFRIDESCGLVATCLGPRLDVTDVFELSTGRRVRRSEDFLRTTHPAYYWKHDGTPALKVERSSDRYADVLDLTSGDNTLAVVTRVVDGTELQLQDGSQVTFTFDSLRKAWHPRLKRSEDGEFESLGRTFYPLTDDIISGAGSVKHAQLSKDFPYVVTRGGRDITLSPLWASARTHEMVVLTGHGADVSDAAAVKGPGGTSALVSCGIDGTVRLWDISAADDTRTRKPTDDPSIVMAAAANDSGRALGVVLGTGSDDPVSVVDLATGGQVAELECVSGPILGAACVSVPKVSDPAAVTFDSSGTARIWNLSSGRQITSFRTHFGALHTQSGRLPVQVAFVPLPGRPLAITCGHSVKPVVWDLVDRRIHDVFSGHVAMVGAIACVTAPDGRRLAAAGGQDNKVSIWDVVRGRRTGRFRVVKRATYLRNRVSGRPVAVRLVASKPRRLVVLLLCEDGTLRIYRNRRWHAGYLRAELDAHGASSLAVMRLGDGREAAVTGGPDGRLCLWDFTAALSQKNVSQEDLACLLEIEVEASITNVAVSGDQSVVVSTLNGLAAFRIDA